MAIDSSPVNPNTPIAASSTGWRRAAIAMGALAIVASVRPYLTGSGGKEKAGPRDTHVVGRNSLLVTVAADGTLESSNNKEIKCRVKGGSTVLWVIEGGTTVKPGDVLVRLDTSTIEDNISQKEITYRNSTATYAQSESAVEVAKINIEEYLKGLYLSELKTKQMDVAVAKANLTVAKNTLEHSEKMFRKGFVSKLELQGAQFSIQQAELDLNVKQTNLDVLRKFTKAKMLQEFRGILKAGEAKLASDRAAMNLEKQRLDRAKKQLENCTIKADSNGMVIFPNAAKWREAPPVEEGATVREDQVLLIMPDLEKMQVKVGVHEAKVDLLRVGMVAKIELQNQSVQGEVKSIAAVTRPAGWWTGNVVKYDTIVQLDAAGLKPGMSAQVKIELADHKDVLTVPVAAVVQGNEGYHCWVKNGEEVSRRSLSLSDSNDQFIVVNSGLKEGDEVVLNPRAYIEEAQSEAVKPYTSSMDVVAKSKPRRNSSSKLAATAPKSK